jgi:DNA-binding NarL/FixJ family response regulator
MQVLLVDDHVMFREGITLLLSDFNESLHFTEAGTCEQALTLLNEKPADLILLDLQMPGTQGLSALLQIRASHPDIPLAVLSGNEDPTTIRQAIDAGASGFVPKTSTSEVLVAALMLILAGGVYLPPAALEMVIDSQDPPSNAQPQASPLSARQTDVLLKAIQGKPNKIIAREMDIAEGTVKAHRSVAFRTLGVHNRTEAVYAAARMGLKPAPHDQS